ncbi:MAG: type IX secretion system outer membrane channel protein PorV [Bacteroidota bacterium]
MRKAIITVACLILIQVNSGAVFGQTGREGSKTITTAAPFLLVTPDSRAGGMGEVGVALGKDANATHWNAASLSFTPGKMGFAMSYSPWLRALGIPDINLAYLSGYYDVNDNGTIGASLRYFSLGTIEYTDINATTIGEDRPNEFALDVAYSLKVTESLGAAVSLRYFYSRLASNNNVIGDIKPVNSVAGDLSLYYEKPFKIGGARGDVPVTFSAGINLSNIGPKVSYTSNTSASDFIPVNMRIGYAFRFEVDEYNSVTFANDFNKLLVPSVQVDASGAVIGGGGRSDEPLLSGIFGSFGDAQDGFGEELAEINTSLGLEYWYRDLFAARIGFYYEDPEKGNRKFITLGAGLRYNVFGLDFAYLAPLEQNHPLQNTLRFTLTYDFDSEGNE